MERETGHNSDDDIPVLSAEASQALQEFLASKNSVSIRSIDHISNGNENDIMKVNELTEDWVKIYKY